MNKAVSESRLAAWVPVLLYHHVVPDPPLHDPYRNFVSTANFESHLRWLRTWGYQSVPLSELESAFTTPGERLRRRAVAITFDDGYADNYEYAWPLLKRYGFDATVFLVTDAIGRDSGFDNAYPVSPMLTTNQIREMSLDGVALGSHTCSHPETLAALDDGELRRELDRSRASLEKLLEPPITFFAYPHSRHDRRVEQAVADAGYRLACGGTGTRFSRFCLTRVPAPDGSGASLGWAIAIRRLKFMVSGR